MMTQRNRKRIPYITCRLGMIRGTQLMLVAIGAAVMGCGSTTQRLATEQLLMSDAVDKAIGQIEFDCLSNQKVYLDTTYLKPVKGFGFVNADYIISSLRQQLTAARCLIQDDRESADIIVEPRVGALGTDGHDVTYGLPQTTALTSAAAVISSSPIPAMPEISFGRSDAQSGIAKVIIFAYDKETKQPVWQSGIAKAESNSSNTWVLGAGPFQKGSIYENVRFAGKSIKRPPLSPNLHHVESDDLEHLGISYEAPFVFEKPLQRKLVPTKEESVAEEKEAPQVQQASFDGATDEDAPNDEPKNDEPKTGGSADTHLGEK